MSVSRAAPSSPAAGPSRTNGAGRPTPDQRRDPTGPDECVLEEDHHRRRTALDGRSTHPVCQRPRRSAQLAYEGPPVAPLRPVNPTPALGTPLLGEGSGRGTGVDRNRRSDQGDPGGQPLVRGAGVRRARVAPAIPTEHESQRRDSVNLRLPWPPPELTL